MRSVSARAGWCGAVVVLFLAAFGFGVSPAAQRPAAELPALGVNTNLATDLPDAQRHAELVALTDMGASWIRIGAPWYALQPDPGDLDATALAKLDAVVADAAGLGLHVLITGDQAPDWAGGGAATASDPAAYGAFMGHVAARLRGHGPDGSSPAYELMNEPNGESAPGKIWATPDDYAHAACAAYRAVKSSDPGTVVAAGALDLSDWRPWLTAAFQAGLGGCFDVFSAHPYGALDVLNDIRATAAAAGAPNVDIWMTEFGASTCADPTMGCVTEEQQGQDIVATLTELRSSYPWVPVAMIYEDRDDLGNPGPASERSFGLYRVGPNGITAKPAVAAVRALYRG